jgi:hypothetical protein
MEPIRLAKEITGWSKSIDIHRDIRVWGCQAWVHVPDAGKLDPKAVEAVFLGIDDVKKGFRLLRLSDRKIVVSRDVVFNETKFPFKQKHESVKEELDRDKDDDVDPSEILGDDGAKESSVDSPVAAPQADAGKRQLRTHREPSSQAIRNIAGGDTEFATLAKRKFPKRKKVTDPNEPSTRKQMLKHPLAEKYLESEVSEYNTLEAMGAWKEIPESEVPVGKTITTIKTVYKPKYEAGGGIERLKSRMTARGFNLTQGIDYGEVYAAVPMLKSFRICVALAQALNYKSAHIDFTNAFINAELKESDYVYVRPPEGFPCKPGHVLKVVKALYGLPNAPREWQRTLKAAFAALGFRGNKADSCIQIHDQLHCFVCFFVDDCAIFFEDPKARTHVVESLRSKFKLTDLGELSRFLNIIVKRKPESTTIYQDSYVRRILENFRMIDCNAADTPAVAPSNLSLTQCPEGEEEKKEMENVPYKSAIGALYYAANSTRPDIAYAVNHCSQFSKNPGKVHWHAVKRILRYLKGTPDRGLTYWSQDEPGPVPIEVYCDSDWGNTEDRRSRTGYVVLINGGVVEWRSTLQHSVATSTCEAEFYAICEAVKEILWLANFLTEMGIPFSKPVVYCDNNGAIELAKHEIFNNRSKHISIKLAFVREAWKEGVFEIRKVGTVDNRSDILTKSVGPQVFSKHVGALMPDHAAMEERG